MEYIIVFAVIAGVAYGITNKIKGKIKENNENQRIREDLLKKENAINKYKAEVEGKLVQREEELEKLIKNKETELIEIEKRITERDSAFKTGIFSGRNWLAEMISEADYNLDRAKEEYLRYKKHPAGVAADVVSQISLEKRELKAKVKFLEYQIKSYEEYFPFLEDWKEFILDERISLSADKDNVEAIESADPALQYVSKEEYEGLSISDRNQLALDRYISKYKNNWEIGRMYERYIGYLRESNGWRVVYQGARRGYEDFGRDLICSNGQIIEIVQAKCWSKYKIIHEKHLFQLYGTSIHYKLENSNLWVKPVFVTTTELSEAAKMVADALKITVEYKELNKNYPMIKCNINPSTLEKIYHLPFDQQYDRAIIGAIKGECYVETVRTAESLGFRRAWRWRGTQETISQT